MKVGDRVRLSAEGRRHGFLTKSRDDRGTVVRPGVYRGGLRIHVKPDGEKKGRSYSVKFWEPEAGTEGAK